MVLGQVLEGVAKTTEASAGTGGETSAITSLSLTILVLN